MGAPRNRGIPPLDRREQRLVRAAARGLDSIPTGGPAPSVFEALRACAPVIGGMIGVMGMEMAGSAISHVVGLPTDVLEGWATTPLPHLKRMMAPLAMAQPGDVIPDGAAITGAFREELELIRVLGSAGLGESAGYKIAARTTLAGKPEHRFVTIALEGGELVTPRQRELFHLLQPKVEAALARMDVPLVAAAPIFAQIIEERREGYLCLSRSHAVVELNERAHEIIFRYLEPARVEPGRGCLARFAEKALLETSAGGPWQLFHPEEGLAVEITAHRLPRAMHHAGQDLTLLMMHETATVPLAFALPDEGMTPRRFEVARLLAKTDLSYKEIAARLGVAEGTIRKHVERVYRAFRVSSRAGLAFKLR